MADQIEVSGAVFVPECVKVHGTLLAWHANSIGNCQNSSLPPIEPEVKPLDEGLIEGCNAMAGRPRQLGPFADGAIGMTLSSSRMPLIAGRHRNADLLSLVLQ